MYYIGIDLGTSAVKLLLMEEDGTIKKIVNREYPIAFPHPGWSEQNPYDWYEKSMDGLKELIADCDRSKVAGISFGGQMHGLVALDETDAVIRPAILWNDSRTEEECNYLNEVIGKKTLSKYTANISFTGFTAPKVLWMKNKEPENFARIHKIMLPKDYLCYRLSGVHATDFSDASGTLFFDVKNRGWSKEMCEICGIKDEWLPKVFESYEAVGTLKPEIGEELGLSEKVVIAAGAGDNAAAAVGTGVVEDGKAFTTIGSSGVVFAHTSDISIDKKGRVHTFCCAVPGCWHVMGVTQSAGLSLKWFRDNFAWSEMETALSMGVDPYYLMDKEAGSVPIGANRLLYMPYLNGERTPHLDPNARGVFFGLSTMHKKKEMLRAVMEGVSYSLRDCVEVMREMNINVSDMMACGGGGTSPLWRQMLADLYGCQVKTTQNKEGPALGVALLAAVGAGIYKSVPEACRAVIKPEKIQEPIVENTAEYEKVYAMYRKLYPAMKQSFAELAQM